MMKVIFIMLIHVVASFFRKPKLFCHGLHIARFLMGKGETSDCGLVRAEDGSLQYWLGVVNGNKQRPLSIDFSASKRGQNPASELVVKAVGRADLVIDLTAGLGRDCLVLASSGLIVHMNERNSILHALLEDGLRRLSLSDPGLYSRLSLSCMDASSLEHSNIFHSTEKDISQITTSCYLDPMYPEGSIGKKALVKKETQFLRRIVNESESNDAFNDKKLFVAAKRLASNRIVVKRPIKALPLLGVEPHAVVKGTTQRFDVYYSNRPIIIP